MVARQRKKNGKKTKKGKTRENRTKEGPRTGVRTSGEANSLQANPVYLGQAQGEEKKHIKRGAKIEQGVSLLFMSFGSTYPHVSWLRQ